MKKNRLLLCKTIVISVKRQVPVFPYQVLRFFNSGLLLQDQLPDVCRNLNIRMKRFIIGPDRRRFSKFAAVENRGGVICLECIFNFHPDPEDLAGKSRIGIIFTFQPAYLRLELADEILALLGLFMKNGRKIRILVRLLHGSSVALYPVVVYSGQVFQENHKVFCIF